jgi:hypothetical protein
MPPFQPNDYLWEKHADKGEEKWEIYAWAMRDLMAKAGRFGKHDLRFRDKKALTDYFKGLRDSYILEEDDLDDGSKKTN